MEAGGNCSHVASSSMTRRSASSGSVGTSTRAMRAAAGSVIHRGTFRLIPSGPRTVMGSSVRRPPETTSSSRPAKGWNG